MKAIILCAGKGTRLRPLSHTSAKHLIPLANKPALEYAIEQIVLSGIKDIGIIISKETGKDIECTIGTGKRWGIKISYILQSEPLGLAHAVKIARPFLKDEPFLMFLGDNLLKDNIEEYRKKFENNSFQAFVLLTKMVNPQQFGVVELKDGKIIGMEEKPQNPKSDLVLIGVYFFDRTIHRAIDEISPSARGELEITDAIQWLVDKKYNVGAEIIDGWWKDTGKPEDIIEANRLILEDITANWQNVNINQQSKVFGRVNLANNVDIIDSIISGPVIIGENTKIINSYIGPFTSLAEGIQIENSEIENSIIMANTSIKNIKNRLQNCLIGKNVTIYCSAQRPLAYEFVLADDSKIRLI